MHLQVGVKVLLRSSDGTFLLIKRRGYEALNETWDIPGGRIDPAESLAVALKREVMEEIGVELTGIPQLIAAQDIFPSGKDIHVVRLTYVVDQQIEDITLSVEHSEYGYFTPDEMNGLSIDPLVPEALELFTSRQ